MVYISMLTQTLPSKLYSCAQCSPLRHPLAALRIVRVSSSPFQPPSRSSARRLVLGFQPQGCARACGFFFYASPCGSTPSHRSPAHRIASHHLSKPTPFPDPWIAARRQKLGTDGRHSTCFMTPGANAPRAHCSRGLLLALTPSCAIRFPEIVVFDLHLSPPTTR